MKYIFLVFITGLLAACSVVASIKIVEVALVNDAENKVTSVNIISDLSSFETLPFILQIKLVSPDAEYTPAGSSECVAKICTLNYLMPVPLDSFDVDSSFLEYEGKRYNLE